MRMRMSVKVEAKKSCESIHSGQFMVSHFEQEDQDEYQDPNYVADDDDEIEEIIDTSTAKLLPGPSTSVCMQLERYKPMTASSRHHEIDSDLSQVFNTLNVTYKQKLTSPRWNPFKGIKLRWKEKIRLNNVIWRCWHMQFILKRRPLVCQFASPLDVDIHNTPQAIILEGKYWKRKGKVITAEYKKWRRYNVTKALGTSNILDTKSELDTLEWATNENLLMLQDNMSSDTLFSTISQIPFPDSREIARAGRADFIQPSLGPLQPNFEDFMDFDISLDILNNLANNRLAPVPEEQTEDLFRAIEFPLISSIDSSAMQDVMSANSSAQQGGVIQSNSSPMNVESNNSAANSLLFTATIFTQDLTQQQQQNATNQQQVMSLQNRQSTVTNQAMMSDLNPFLSGELDISQQQQQQSTSMAHPQNDDDKDSYKGKFSRMSQWKAQLPKREPHNYDKCQPTPHQTTIYNQMLAQQQEVTSTAPQMYNANPYMTDNATHMSPIQTTTNNYTNAAGVIASTGGNGQNALNLSNNQIYANNVLMNLQQQSQQSQSMGQMVIDQHDSTYKSPQSPSYRSYHHSNQQPYKIPSQSGYGSNRMMMRQPSPPHTSGNIGKSMSFQVQQQQQHPQSAAAAAIKESYRSNSLPINANIQLSNDLMTSGCDFAVPKYPNVTSSTSAIVSGVIAPGSGGGGGGKGRNPRGRSNSITTQPRHGQLMPSMQSATSEPTLNANASSALAQLLTNTSGVSLLGQKAHSISSSAMSHSTTPQQPKQHQQPQRANSFTSSSLVQNSILMAVSSMNQQATTSCHTPTLSPESSAFHHDGGGSGSHHEMSSSMSPERCLSLSKYHPRENSRRAGHIHAEQKRRYNIKNGFDMLHQLIPQLQQNPNAKLSKAAMLQKGADYIKQLRMERSAISEQMESLKAEIDSLTNSLNHLQNALPANGAPINRQRTGRVRQMYQDHVMQMTMQNWKFWIFGLIFEPLLNSFNGTVSTVSMDELYRTSMLWIDNSCTLMEIRPAVSNKLRELSTTTDILSENPTTLQDEVLRAVANLRSRSHESPR